MVESWDGPGLVMMPCLVYVVRASWLCMCKKTFLIANITSNQNH